MQNQKPGRAGRAPVRVQPDPKSRLIPHYVVEVLGKPYRESSRWRLRVRATCHGRAGEHLLAFAAREDALGIGFGYWFLEVVE